MRIDLLVWVKKLLDKSNNVFVCWLKLDVTVDVVGGYAFLFFFTLRKLRKIGTFKAILLP